MGYIKKNRVTRCHQHGGDCSDGLDQGLRREEPGADFVDRRSEGNHSLEQPKSSCRWGGGGMIAFSVAFLTLNYIRRRISDLLNTLICSSRLSVPVIRLLHTYNMEFIASVTAKTLVKN